MLHGLIHRAVQNCLYQACNLPAVTFLTFPWNMVEYIPSFFLSDANKDKN